MPRHARQCPVGYVYHVWNRGAGRLRLFKKPADYEAFERLLLQAHRLHPIDLLEWCLMPNHWHFVVRPRRPGQVTSFFRWLTHTHAMRAITHRRVMGMGPLYQGRFKSLPVQEDDHLLALLRYVQRNPVRAGRASHVWDWRWGSAHVRESGPADLRALLAPWPLPYPPRWRQWVSQPDEQAVGTIRDCIRRSRPWGADEWTRRTANQLGLGWTLRPRGRPRREDAARGEHTVGESER